MADTSNWHWPDPADGDRVDTDERIANMVQQHEQSRMPYTRVQLCLFFDKPWLGAVDPMRDL